MTLKHSNKAKWAKKQKSREHRDPAVSIYVSIPIDRQGSEGGGKGEPVVVT